MVKLLITSLKIKANTKKDHGIQYLLLSVFFLLIHKNLKLISLKAKPVGLSSKTVVKFSEEN